MSQSKFADFVGVSKQMVSKYKADGRLAMQGDLVDAARSLEKLEGTFDETKRRAAIARLQSQPAPSSSPAAAPVNDDAPTLSWKAERERADAMIRKLDLEERMGQLVDARMVRLAIADVVSQFWSETERRQSLDVSEMAAALGLDPEQTRALRSALRRRDEDLRRAFSGSLMNSVTARAPSRAA
jgi:transcriptional regulator with XRE-family HTH domain